MFSCPVLQNLQVAQDFEILASKLSFIYFSQVFGMEVAKRKKNEDVELKVCLVSITYALKYQRQVLLQIFGNTELNSFLTGEIWKFENSQVVI